VLGRPAGIALRACSSLSGARAMSGSCGSVDRAPSQQGSDCRASMASTALGLSGSPAISRAKLRIGHGSRFGASSRRCTDIGNRIERRCTGLPVTDVSHSKSGSASRSCRPPGGWIAQASVVGAGDTICRAGVSS